MKKYFESFFRGINLIFSSYKINTIFSVQKIYNSRQTHKHVNEQSTYFKVISISSI